MDNFKNWFWEIVEKGQGPDYVFLATFDSSEAEQLENFIRQYPLPGFRYVVDAQPPYPKNGASYRLYVDEHTFDRTEAARIAGEEVSIWYYTQIDVCNCEFAIYRVLSGSQDSSQAQTETNLIFDLVQSPLLNLVEWKVAYSGYSWDLIKSGTNATELLEYLHL